MIYLYLEDGSFTLYDYKINIFNYMDLAFIGEFKKEELKEVIKKYNINSDNIYL